MPDGSIADIVAANPAAAWRALDCADARESLADFCGLIDIPGAPVKNDADDDRVTFQLIETPPAAHHKLLISKLQAVADGLVPRLMIFMPPGSAKALALDTLIPTPSGWSRMGDLKVGDRVFGDDGRPCNVTWVSPTWRNRPVYRVTTDCGDEVIADRDHEWRVRLCGKPRRLLSGARLGRPGMINRDDPATRFKVKETHELHRRRAKRPMIERAKALELPDVDLPIDPYLLGVWLGDGTSATLSITSSLDDQSWLRAELERRGFTTASTTVPTLFRVHGVRSRFVALGLLKDPHHRVYGRKHIPEIYMRASRRQRLELLQGLVDTDGTVCKRRGSTTFCNTNLELAEQVRELVRSLGVKAGWSVGRAILNGVDHGPYYQVSFYMAGSARLPRKAVRTRDQSRTPNTYIDVEPAGYADTVCIEVDSPSHLFLCGRSMTPTHNSTYASVVFPTWCMGRRPRTNIGVATYATDLGRKLGRRARAIVRQPTYREIFGTGLSPDSGAADEWALDNGNEFMACGILAGWTGNRLDGAIIDDPVKNRQEADSEVTQKRTKEEFDDSIKTRLKPGGWIVLILTRWSEKDLAGQLLPENWNGESGPILCRDGQVWEVLCVPAQAEENDVLGRKPGAMLWAEWFGGEEHWSQFRAIPRTWSALYQQRPTPGDGTFFQRSWFRRFRPGTEPADLRKYLTSDHAPTDGEDSDPSGCRVWGLDALKNIYLLDGFCHRQNMSVTADRIIALIKKHRPFAWFPEDDNNWKTAEPFILLRMKQESAATRIAPMSPHGQDKAAKAQSFQGMAAMGSVWVPEGPEGDAVIDQLVKFPAGAHDEEVDMAAIMGRAIAMAHPAIVPASEAPKPSPRGVNEMTWDELMAMQAPRRERV